jgi:arylsulfatase A
VQRSKPNIVMIIADDLGYGDFGFINGGRSATPALDQLAADGVVLGQHYSASPVCAPARAALLTGRYPQRCGVIDTLEARGTDRLDPREATLADVLKQAGYRTGLVGKWHNGALEDRYHPTRRGFDEFVGFRGGWQDYWQWTLDDHGRTRRADGRYLTDVWTEEAIGFIDRHTGDHGDPFFLMVTYNAPHFPFQAPEESIERFRQPGRSERVATIYAMIAAVDSGVAAIRQKLADAGCAENTLIMFSSDNGPQLDGVGDESTVRFNAGLAGAKQHVYEGGIRLPMLASLPGALPAGEARDAFVHFTDWLPTLAGIAGARPDLSGLPLDGRDVWPMITGEQKSTDDRTMCWQWTRYRPVPESNAAIRSGRWKLVRPALGDTIGLAAADERRDTMIKYEPERFTALVTDDAPAYPDFTGQARSHLYDLLTDPGETVDLADRQPERTARLEAELSAWYEDVEAERISRHVSHR